MAEIIKLKTVNIKTLSRNQLEAAYLRLRKVSEMKTALIRLLEQQRHGASLSENNIKIAG